MSNATIREDIEKEIKDLEERKAKLEKAEEEVDSDKSSYYDPDTGITTGPGSIGGIKLF